MNRTRIPMVLALMVAAVLFVALGACKSSGMAVTNDAQFLKVNIDAPTDMTEGDTKEVKVAVSNRGLNKISNNSFDVEFPPEIVVLSETHGNGIKVSEARAMNGNRLFHFETGSLNVGETSEVNFHVRSAFGTLRQSGDIVVTAFNADLPGGKLVESKYVKLRD